MWRILSWSTLYVHLLFIGIVAQSWSFLKLFIRPLRAAQLPLPDPSERGVDEFLRDIFHNYNEVLGHHRRLLEAMHDIQREEYPCIASIVAPLYDAALNWRDSYMEYVAHYPIARYRAEEAMSIPQFKKVVEVSLSLLSIRLACVSYMLIARMPKGIQMPDVSTSNSSLTVLFRACFDTIYCSKPSSRKPQKVIVIIRPFQKYLRLSDLLVRAWTTVSPLQNVRSRCGDTTETWCGDQAKKWSV